MKAALDLDGTLLTCRPKQMACLKHVLRRFGLSADLAAIWDAKREGATTREALLGIGFSAAEADALSKIWADCIEEPFWLSFDRLLEGVTRELTLAHPLEAKPNVLTARSRPEWVLPQLNALGLLQHVGKVFIVPPRSAAQSKALLLLETKPDVFIGDSESDYEAARVAGVRFVAVATGQRSRKYLLSKGVAEVSASFGDAFLAAQQTLRV